MTEIASSSSNFSTWDCSNFSSAIELAHHHQATLQELQLEFQNVLNSKCAISVVGKQYNTVSLSASITDSTSISLHYQDFMSLHSILSQEDVIVLRSIAEILSSTDYYSSCVQVYILLRKDIINMIYEILQEKINMEAVCKLNHWEELSEKIQRWIQIAKICIGNIFVKEKLLYEQIFEGLGTDGDSQNFVHIIGDAAAKLFEFPDSVMASRRLPQRLDIFLPLNQELLNLMPTVDQLFCKNSSLPRIHACATGIMSRFTEHMSRILSASERHVLNELSMNPTPGGGLHSLTLYVIGYMDLISNHSKSLGDLIATTQVQNDPTAPQLDSLEPDSSPLKHHLIRIIEFLIYNLRYKSKFYEQDCLNHLFMMNNVHSVTQKIRGSQGLQELIGIKFLKKLTSSVEQAKDDYLKCWEGICHCLRDHERSKPNAKWFFSWKSARDTRMKLKAFNQKIEIVSEIQDAWEVPDEQLKQKLQKSILDMLIPAYSQFLAQYSGHIAKFQIKHSVKDLETKVLNMF